MAAKMRKAVILVHGIATTASWSKGIGQFAPAFEAAGYAVEIAAWNPGGWGFFFRPLVTARPVASTVARWALHLKKLGVEEIVGVGHSHGCRLLALASEYGAPFRALAFLSAAVDRDVKIGRQVDWVLNWHAPGDHVVKLAAAIPFHPWGSLGASGFSRERLHREPRLRNYSGDFGDDPAFAAYSVADHSDWFHTDRVSWWAKAVADTIQLSREWSATSE